MRSLDSEFIGRTFRAQRKSKSLDASKTEKVMRIGSWAVIVACACATLAFADKRPITEKDFLKFKWVADSQISSD
jgi:hypothetical protein